MLSFPFLPTAPVAVGDEDAPLRSRRNRIPLLPSRVCRAPIMPPLLPVDERASDALRIRKASFDGCDGIAAAGVWSGSDCWSWIRTHISHHPRLVLHVRSVSRGRERVSIYVLRN